MSIDQMELLLGTGRSGVDGRTVDDFAVDVHEHWPTLPEQLLTGRYKTSAVAVAHCHRWWATAVHPGLHHAFSTQYFDTLVVPRLGPL